MFRWDKIQLSLLYWLFQDTLRHIHTTAIWRTIAVLLSAFTEQSALYRQNEESLLEVKNIVHVVFVVLTEKTMNNKYSLSSR
jgi:hypothetical protein